MTRRLLSLSLACLALGACGDDEQQAATQGPASAAAAKPVAPAAAAAEEKPQFSYSPVGKRDPFQSYLPLVDQGSSAALERKREATEEYELDQYKLTGLVTGTSQPKGMVEDPDGKGFPVKIGTRLGKRGGVITRITSDGIVVTEEFRTPTGDKVRVPIAIKLPQPELEGME